MDDLDKPYAEQQACTEIMKGKRLLWCSDKSLNANGTYDYYADSLHLLHIDDGKWALRLIVGGTAMTFPIANIEKYV